MKSKVITCITSLVNIETTFNADEWRAYRNNAITELDLFLDHNYNTDFIKYKKYLLFGVTLSVSFFLMTVNANAETLTAFSSMEKIDKLGATFVRLIQQAGYWICFAKGLIDIIKELLKGGDKADGIGKIMIKYVLSFSAFYLFPFFFDLIKSCFV